MSEVTYEQVSPLISSLEEQGAAVRVTFRCPVGGQEFSASARMRKREGIGDKVASRAKRRASWSLKNTLARTVRSAMGHGLAGSIAADATRAAADGATSGGSVSFGEAEKREAVVDAFESISSNFVWDAGTQRYISAASAGATRPDLLNQLDQAPVLAPYDRGILARMLAEVAAADGELEAEERGFFEYFITPDMGTLDSIVARPPLSPTELSETSQGAVRETMLMLAWSVALTDRTVDSGELQRLNHFAESLGIAGERAAELKLWAQRYLIDCSLSQVYTSGARDQAAYQQVQQLGATIGLTADEVERVDIRYRKRYGLT